MACPRVAGFPPGLSCSQGNKGHIPLGDRAWAQTSAQGLPPLLLSLGPPSHAQFSRENHCYEVATTQDWSLSRVGLAGVRGGRDGRGKGGLGLGMSCFTAPQGWELWLSQPH